MGQWLAKGKLLYFSATDAALKVYGGIKRASFCAKHGWRIGKRDWPMTI